MIAAVKVQVSPPINYSHCTPKLPQNESYVPATVPKCLSKNAKATTKVTRYKPPETNRQTTAGVINEKDTNVIINIGMKYLKQECIPVGCVPPTC